VSDNASTRLRLDHLGEPLVAELLQEISHANGLERLQCRNVMSGEIQSVKALLASMNCNAPISFCENVPLAPISYQNEPYSFDGLSQIDVLAAGDACGLGIEVKLGTTRMSPSEFERRFLRPCVFSNHVPPRINGSMIAILDGRFPQNSLEGLPLSASLEDGTKLTLASSWVLVLRRQVFQSWGTKSPEFNRACWVLVFEDFVAAVGGAAEFDRVAHRIVGDRFAEAWCLQ
jgi:hypothetical protein